MKQKFGTRLTSLLLCLALVAGLLQGLPVTAKAASPVPPSAVKLSLPLEQAQLLPVGYLAQISA